MNILLAHHIEAHHVPVLLALGAAGFWIGWDLVARVLARRTGTSKEEA